MVTQQDFDAFYRAHFADTVAMTYAYTGELAAAQDIVQEAFCRAWQRWSDVHGYDNPVAWVRRVALNIARSRWRHLRIARAHLVRQRSEPVGPPEPDHVALVAALRMLSEDQRRAIVLHHLMDLPVADVARQMDAAEGTVKSWLSRGRTALATQLSDDLRAGLRASVSVPEPADLRRRAERQRTLRRVATSAAAAFLVLLAVAAMAFVRGGHAPVVPGETPSPTSPSPTPQGSPITRADLQDPIRQALTAGSIGIDLDTRPGCPAGHTTFRRSDGTASSAGYPKMVLEIATMDIGDLTGDGRAEAAIYTTCLRDAEDSADGSGDVMVVRLVDGTLHAIAHVGQPGSLVPSLWIDNRVLYTDAHPWHDDWGYRLGQARAFRWNGAGFASLESGFPALYPGSVLHLGSVLDRAKSSCAGVPWRDPGPLSFDEQARADDGDRIWLLIQPQTPDSSPHLIAVGSPRRIMLLAAVTCMPTNVLDPALQTNLVLFERDSTGWVAVRAFQETPTMTVIGWHMDGTDLMVNIGPIGIDGHSHMSAYPLT